MDTTAALSKKMALEHVEAALPTPNINDTKPAETEDDIPQEEQRRIMRRVDFRVTAVTGAMFCISLMDRTNLGAASIAG